MGKLFEDQTLRNRYHVFSDRSEAGRLLSERLRKYRGSDAFVLAIPAGGVPVGVEIARDLHIPIDLVMVRKVQIPGNTEAGFGAVGPDGDVVLNDALVRELRLTAREIEQQTEKTRKVLQQRNRIFRKDRPLPDLSGKTVILVDDGLASGYTMTVAIAFLKKKAAGKIIVAVPTAPEHTVNAILPDVDEMYCLNVRTYYPFAVAEAYIAWHDLKDEEVLSLIRDFPS
jgi:predicted phosphoribosyltransferase